MHLIALMSALLMAPGASAPRYVDVSLAQLKLSAPLPEPPDDLWRAARRERAELSYYVTLDGGGEAYLGLPERERGAWDFGRLFPQEGHLWLKLRPGQPIQGKLIVPKPDLSGVEVRDYRLAMGATPKEDPAAFFKAKARHYRWYLARGLPGAAWWRDQGDEAAHAAGEKPSDADRLDRRARMLDSTYDLFAGGRALSENLQLDRVLNVNAAEAPTIDINTIEGITTQEMDFKALLPKDAKLDLDPLAQHLPADQHALFFPSFKAMIEVMDEADTIGTLFLSAIEPRSESAETRARYEAQLTLGVSQLARTFGPAFIRSVAFTGADPYLRTGADLALLFEAKNASAVLNYVRGKHQKAIAEGGVASKGQIGGVPYEAVTTPDRRVSSYLASWGDVVVVSNSLAQLGRLVAVHERGAPALIDSPEYRYFRFVYPRGDGDLFAILTDATIRRWASPRWRIADSRRTRAGALLAATQAHEIARSFGLARRSPGFALGHLPGIEDIRVEGGIARSATWGSLSFLTPISEMPLSLITESEKAAYERFRRSYQNNWREFFDPIAFSAKRAVDRLEFDLSVMPLIAGSDYRELIRITGDQTIAQDAGDPHADALLHYIMAIDPNGRHFQDGLRLFKNMAPNITDPLGWIGASVALFADADPFWAELAQVKDHNKFMRENFHRTPVGVRLEVKSAMKLTLFLAGIKGLLNSAAPGMLTWDTLTYKEKPYVVIRPTEHLKKSVGDEIDKLAIYYAVTPRWILFSLNESVIQRALARDMAPVEEKKAVDSNVWIGKQVAGRVSQSVFDLIENNTQDQLNGQLQQRAWANIPILNVWHDLYPNEDPVDVHLRLWGVKLQCPGHGVYVWDPDNLTMSSSVYGSPLAPKSAPFSVMEALSIVQAHFGLTFEHDGLRARLKLERAKKD
ncbi:hypothetical protein KKF91_05060 [Myxococcota bacterium]|nr:hypothetical protein [Myxococcota bacterium]MBU1429917.1 hypothetical protein [Myxococcota bacterium]MBU1898902.1 hypothetical protein [Myxococcota bacterium]